jgi:hypothetical protein
VLPASFGPKHTLTGEPIPSAAAFVDEEGNPIFGGGGEPLSPQVCCSGPSRAFSKSYFLLPVFPLFYVEHVSIMGNCGKNNCWNFKWKNR